ncbi:MAG: ABC transporter ATP-binding protein [Clostridia bacterium]|nr:ABC transporter ATP-binding protein [Clostridia bacterium]MBR4442963.1 ABC transporter ATP-binding protein [Clostridia bacterium]
MIKVQGLEKSYENRKVLRGLSLTVQPGEIVALTGLKGAGKTTALDIIAGVAAADRGTVEINGIVLDSETSGARQLVGYAPAEPAAPRDMSPRAWLKFLADARGLSAREASEKIDASIKLLGIQDVSDKRMSQLSRAALQLASIAQAVFHGPEAVLIDEPTQNLDPKDILTLRAAVRTVAKGRAVLLASSNLTEMCALCDRVLVLSDGRVVSEGTPDQLHNMTRVGDAVRIVARADEAAARAAFSAVKGAEIANAAACAEGVELTVKMSGDQREALFLAAAKAGLPVLEMTAARKPLESLLDALTTERVEGGGEEA